MLSVLSVLVCSCRACACVAMASALSACGTNKRKAGALRWYNAAVKAELQKRRVVGMKRRLVGRRLQCGGLCCRRLVGRRLQCGLRALPLSAPCRCRHAVCRYVY